MSDPQDMRDEELVAYLDGELEPDARTRVAQRIAEDHALQRRLILLSGGNRPFREAFAPLLEAAPRKRLEAMLENLPISEKSDAEGPRPIRHWSMRLRVIAASLLLFLSGLGIGALMPNFSHDLFGQSESASENSEWRQVVAEYLTLYTTQTLASIPDNASVRDQEVAIVGARIGLALTPQTISLPNLSFKRAQLLEYDSKPLGQFSYLDEEGEPVVLCIIAEEGPDDAPQMEQREGFNIVYWSRGRHSFMLIGRVLTWRLQEISSELTKRLT